MMQVDISAPERRRARAERADHRESTRERLVRRGVELLTEHSFNGTTLDVILKELAIPKGSFYYYFASKQAFGEAVVDAYAGYFDERFDRIFDDTSGDALRQLRDYISECADGMSRHGWRRGCLVGNLAQELGAHNEVFRDRLERVFRSWQARIVACLNHAVRDGQVKASADTESLARFFWIGWEGSLMRAKLTRSAEPLECFAENFFRLLPAPEKSLRVSSSR